MESINCYGKILLHPLYFLFKKLWSSFFLLVSFINPFFIQLFYFVLISLFGYLALRVSKPKHNESYGPRKFDIFFTSVSASTVSSMSTVEMEYFSSTQLVILTMLMLFGGEVFTSLLELLFGRSKLSKKQTDTESRVTSLNISDPNSPSKPVSSVDNIELGLVSVTCPQLEYDNRSSRNLDNDNLKCNSLKCLVYVVFGYILVVHIVGSSTIALYMSLIPSAKRVLMNKGLQTFTFSTFVTVSTFSNCGFIPTNENMMAFQQNSGLLLLVMALVLLGNTFYAPVLHFLIWVLEKITKRQEFRYIRVNPAEVKYAHLFSKRKCIFVAGSALGLVLVQLILFCSLEWNSGDLTGLNSYQKFVASLFQVVNSRHAGENVIDLSTLSQAILGTFVVMMYLPPYTSFWPIKEVEDGSRNCKQGKDQRKLTTTTVECLSFSQLTYLCIFIILICITETEKLKNDPLNFNVLSITVEVTSAYGNVGFTTGYNCKRQINPLNNICKDASYGLSGRMSDKGKLVMIVVMFFGRLKNFTKNGGKAWKLYQ